MSYGPGPKQFLDAEQRRIELEKDRFHLQYTLEISGDRMSWTDMIWNAANMEYSKIMMAYILGADTTLREAAAAEIMKWAQLSIAKRECRSYERPLTEVELRRQYYKDVGKIFTMKSPVRPEAWLNAHYVLFYDHWFKTGTMDHAGIVAMLAEPMEGANILESAYNRDLAALGQWDALAQIETLEHRFGEKVKPSKKPDLWQLLAHDPAQLHDRKSPARVRARSQMRRSMELWINDGLVSEAFRFLLTFEWREGKSGLSPQEVMWRAYAYMPSVMVPPHIASQVEQLRKIPI